MSVLTILLAVTVIFAQGVSSTVCHCTNGCQSVPGTPCTANSSGHACMDDWFGKYCQIQNIAFGKTADQSSTYNEGLTQYNAALAVDGNNDTNFHARSCSHTNGAGTASWHVILDTKLIFNISRIRIYLRNDNIDQWHDNDMDVMVSGQLCQHFERSSYVIGETLKDNPLDVTCSPPIRGRNVTIAMNASFLSLCEVQVFVCGDGWFGNDCEHKCQCRNLAEVCDKQSGYCSSGCAVGRYGDGCLGSCHCSNGCDSFPGAACSTQPVPVCKPHWFGPYCQMENIAFGKTADQSSTYNDGVTQYNAALAVDGNNDTNFNVILDTKLIFNISRIRIYLRDDVFDKAHYNDMDVMVSGQLCQHFERSSYVTGADRKENPLDVTCSPPIRGRNVTIAMNASYLSLCEVQVLVCSDGWFGKDCNNQCQCRNKSEICDKDTGYCRSKCPPGKMEFNCLQDCPKGWFGKECTKKCQCRDPKEICTKTSGSCTHGCVSGKQGEGCQQPCGQQRYGVNCNSSCGQCSGSLDCLKENGTCTNGCKAGYNPPMCQECVQGFYGPSCTKCGRCKNSDACDIHNGTCLGGCESGYLKPTCLQECQHGTYGEDCLQVCGACSTGVTCNHTSGVCETGCLPHHQDPYCKVCHDSWFGTNCTKKCKCNNITEVCDKANGNCRSGCLAGKRGSGCQDDCASGQYGFNCSFTCGHCYDVASCRIDDGNCTRGCKVGYSPPLCKGTASLLKNENSGHKTDVRFIIVCYLMVVLGAYSAAATTLVFRLKQKVAKTNAELEKQYVSLEPRGDSSVYDVIAGAHTYCNDVQPEDSDYENTTRNIMKRGEHSL